MEEIVQVLFYKDEIKNSPLKKKMLLILSINLRLVEKLS